MYITGRRDMGTALMELGVKTSTILPKCLDSWCSLQRVHDVAGRRDTGTVYSANGTLSEDLYPLKTVPNAWFQQRHRAGSLDWAVGPNSGLGA